MLPRMLEEDPKRAGWSVGQAAWRLGVTVREYREIEAGARTPSFGTWDRISDCSADHRRSRWQAHEEPTRMSEFLGEVSANA
jgi:Helix-turn-helix domain